jgi:hypothetical protein
MTSPYVSYRLRFHPDATRDQLRETIADLVMLLHSGNIWPGVLHPAGASKQQAMKKAFDLTRRDAVLQLAEKIIGTRRWPEIGGGRYWSDTKDDAGDDRFVLNFYGHPFGAKWFNRVTIEHSPRFADQFRAVIDQLGRRTATPFVVFVLSRNNPGEVRQASMGDGIWLDVRADAKAVKALERLTERD